MNVYYITGTHKGIGKAIAEQALKEDGNFIYGLSRQHSIEHDRYEPITIDLSKTEEIDGWDFPLPENSQIDKVILINNAGVIEPVKNLGFTFGDAIEYHYKVNVIAPVILMNHFLGAFRNSGISQVVINISSGAGKHPVDGWACYCSSKAALDMVSEVAAVENKNQGNQCRVYALAPGIVDTSMQDAIRSADPAHFSRFEEFQNYKKEGLLKSPDEIACKFIEVVNHPDVDLDIIDQIQ